VARAGIGRGLEAILSASGVEAPDAQELRMVPVELIRPNPRQPRTSFDEEALRALAASLGERGVLQPVLVRPRVDGSYELIAGERRWRAAQLAGLPEIPAVVREDGDVAALELALIENMAREDLSPVDEARACAGLVEELGLTHEDVAARVGRSRAAVTNLIRLLDLPDEAIELLERGELSEGHGRALLLAEDHGARRRLARAAVAEGWSVRVTEERARASSGTDAGDGKAAFTGARTPLHADQLHAASQIAELLSGAIGAEVKVRPRRDGCYSVELRLDSPEQAAELARRMR
jgi:ParB family chromosome partitioning protein